MLPDVIDALNVSRETFHALKKYAAMIGQWTTHINLIAPSTVPDIWHRHICDSAQIYPYVANVASVADLGAGGGLPGIVLAILGSQNVHLIESDKRKCVFLQECVRELALTQKTTIHQKRIESCESLTVDAVVSRACAPLQSLLSYASHHRNSAGKCVFLKGKQIKSEIIVAKAWKLNYTLHPSLTDSEGVILEIKEMEKRHD